MKVAFHADDAGLSDSIDEGIEHSIRFGVVRSTSLVACGASLTRAITRLVGTDVSIGIHLTLDEEVPLCSPGRIPSLVTDNGTFLDRTTLLWRLSVPNLIDLREVECELRHQFEVIRDTGLKITHIDGHGHIHVHPRVAPIVAQLARRFGIRTIRQPMEPFSYRAQGRLNRRTLNRLVVAAMTLSSRSNFQGRDFNPPLAFYGVSHGGQLTEASIGAILDHGLRQSTIEVMCHPGCVSPDALKRYGYWGYDWESEVKALTSQSLIERLQFDDIELGKVGLLDV